MPDFEFDFLPNHPAGVCAPAGWRSGNTYCGLKTYGAGKLDLGLLVSDVPAAAAGVFTTNVVRAAPVFLCEEVVKRGQAQAVIYNAGIANACTGEQGMLDAREMTRIAALKLDIDPKLVLVTSTGVIGHLLPIEKIQSGVSNIELQYGEPAGASASFCIMTTDTRPKRCVVRLKLDGKTVHIGGMCKGAGMIHPNMATMLCYLTTDAAATSDYLQKVVRDLVDDSFNSITVDGDTSTNDSVLLLANGLAGNTTLGAGATPEEEQHFKAALREVMVYLAKEIARDGEGATKLIEVRVRGAQNKQEARLAARTAAGSSLLKSAVYGSDPNWGRVIAAMGRSGAIFDSNKTDIWIGEVPLMLSGTPQKFEKASAQAALKGPNVIITVDMHTGNEGEAIAWGCDLTEQYVVINSEYET
ncbi:MAG: bifunctional glutamate N-acetyltransferase/amino-acid acetyltransferase ArgJ [Chloroflexi bacterium]|uniref:Arginine biosynthesis bifunctional protein ArgJ n=1 Tax=Candidatus Chlorohelix allophototropha TaxID=3003348 RepID=A0A8T7M3H1_9CHLR|nr:bifunctional glutamate N-acetyltransferase/amino-acid acetyltransferase ArgJ [Chloroflexota bacterium]WJW65985.1 bifunctional glutamate N-acetyltransferase/amino-acid acetyltransferase ArgJ [Chloroflexota bacterium L227-S17]